MVHLNAKTMTEMTEAFVAVVGKLTDEVTHLKGNSV
jgi:hypothetical protein